MMSFWSSLLGRRRGAHWFVRIRSGALDQRMDRKWREWINSDAANEESFARLAEGWEAAAHVEDRPGARKWLLDVDQLAATQTAPAPRRMPVAWIATAAVVCGVALTAVLTALWHERTEVVAGHFETAIGEHRAVVLPDQSQAELNTATRIEIRFSRTERGVNLQEGEVLFDVRKDPSRPFVVRTEGGAVTAVGTRFAVHRTPGGKVDVAVLEGAVTVSHPLAGKRTVQLVAGQQVSYSSTGEISAVSAADTLRIEGWRSGRLVFQDKSLSDTLLEFNRYTRTPVVLESAGLASRRFGGVFRTGETQSFLDALKASLDVDVVKEQDRIIIRAKEPKPR